MRIARQKNCDWLIHIDSDELLHPLLDLHKFFDACEADAVRFDLLEAVPEKEYYDHIFMPTLFRRKSTDLKMRVARILGCKAAFFGGDFLRGHLESKAAIRLTPRVRRIGIHGVIEHEGPLEPQSTKQVRLLHFDSIGLADWIRKWETRRDGPGKAKLMREARARQFALFKTAGSDHEAMARVYRKLYFIPGREKLILLLLGMLSRVRLDARLFRAKVSEDCDAKP
jgi:hypothetical protein